MNLVVACLLAVTPGDDPRDWWSLAPLVRPIPPALRA